MASGLRRSFLALCGVLLGALTITAVDVGPAARAAGPKANIVFILADDFAVNLMQYMPNLQALQKDGTTFSNYFVTDSLCCPSRSSILTGKLPHDTHVLTNNKPDGGFAVFNSHGNQDATFALALQKAGYRTAMLGKYLNGYEPKQDGPPPGWTEWDVAGNGYPEFNYDLNENGKVVHFGKTPDAYLTDVISGLGQDFIKKAGTNPFLIEIATFAPHAPYTPAPRDANAFTGVGEPRTPAFGVRPDTSQPKWLQAIPALATSEITTIDAQFRMRVQAVQAIDKMLGEIRAALAASGQDKNTYVVFSSDNGYHMGEYSLRPGKQTAFDTDIHVPLVVAGPGVAKGSVVDAVTENIDLAPTFAEIGGGAAPLAPDGHSLMPLLGGQPATDWRLAALIEHHRPARFDNTDPDKPEKNSANPPSYGALRMANSLYVEYDDGDVAFYDLKSDPNELKNTALGLAPADKQKLHNELAAGIACHGASACWDAQRFVNIAAAASAPAIPPSAGPAQAKTAGLRPRPNAAGPRRQN